MNRKSLTAQKLKIANNGVRTENSLIKIYLYEIGVLL